LKFNQIGFIRRKEEEYYNNKRIQEKKKMTEKEKTNASQTWERITQRAVGGISYIIL
jgi:hypothetical protein